MTGKPSARPYDATPYASLRQTEAAGTTLRAAGAPNAAAASEFKAEADKLRQLRQALWTAFEAGAEAGLPNTLIDLTMAYTGTLRLQLSLKAIMARQPAAKVLPVSSPTPARDPDSKT